jgi:hypothetical protein
MARSANPLALKSSLNGKCEESLRIETFFYGPEHTALVQIRYNTNLTGS